MGHVIRPPLSDATLSLRVDVEQPQGSARRDWLVPRQGPFLHCGGGACGGDCVDLIPWFRSTTIVSHTSIASILKFCLIVGIALSHLTSPQS